MAIDDPVIRRYAFVGPGFGTPNLWLYEFCEPKRDLLSWYFQKEIVGKTFSESSPRKLKIVFPANLVQSDNILWIKQDVTCLWVVFVRSFQDHFIYCIHIALQSGALAQPWGFVKQWRECSIQIPRGEAPAQEKFGALRCSRPRSRKKNIIVNFWPRIHVQNPGASWEYSRPDQLGPRARTTPWPPHINFKTVALAIVGAMRSVQCCVSAPRTVVASLARRASTTQIQFSIQKLQKEPNLCLAWSGARCDCSRLAKKGWSRLCLWSVFITSQLA